ncbi:MAG: Phosphoribosylformylglycinamidine synthase, partial [Bacteroidota bacterium]
RLFVEADSQAAAEEKVTLACQKMLANQIMESFHFTVTEA